MKDRTATYHGRPALKPAGFDSRVAAYIALLGTAGAAQLLSLLADGDDSDDVDGIVQDGRALGVAGSVVGAAVLMGHLKTPRRWYNMLRILRPQSPMSWGSWLLTGFGGTSFLTWLAGRLGWKRTASMAQVPAALAGAGVATYTASLLSATSNPLWAAAPGPLAAQFAASSMAGGASAIALLQRRAGNLRRAEQLEDIARLALLAEWVAMQATEDRWRKEGVAQPMRAGTPGLLAQGGAKGIGVLAPIVLAAIGRPGLASAAILAGGALMRLAVLRAGDASATRPRDSLHFARKRLP